MNLGLPNKLEAIDPLVKSVAQTKYLLTLIYEPLVRVSANQELTPALSPRWTIDKIKQEAIFSIDTNRKFSDGTPVTSKDVVQSLKASCKSENDSSKDLTAIVGCGKNAKVHIVDSAKISISFHGPPSILLYQLAGFRAGIFKIADGRILGSGPYVVEGHDSQVLQLRKNAFYFQPQTVKNSGLNFIGVGESDVADKIQKEDLDGTIMFRFGSLERPIPNFSFVDDQSNISHILVPNLARRPFDDVNFRRALMKLLSSTSFSDCTHGIKPAKGIIPIGLGGSIAHIDLPTLESSINDLKAKYKGTKITIEQHVGRKNMCEEKRISEAFGQLGVDVNFRYHTEYSTLVPRINSHKADAFLELYIFANREAMTIFRKFSRSGDNLSNIKDSVVDRGLEQIYNADSAAERFKSYRDLNKSMYEEAVAFPLYYMHHRNAVSKCIDGISSDFAFNPFFGLSGLTRRLPCKK